MWGEEKIMMCSSRRSGRAFVFGKFDGDIDERRGNQYQSGRNLRTGHNVPNAHWIHRECLSNMYANHINTIPMMRDRVKTNRFNVGSGSSPGAIKIIPYHPAERLPQIPERTFCQEHFSLSVIPIFSPQYNTVKAIGFLYAIT